MAAAPPAANTAEEERKQRPVRAQITNADVDALRRYLLRRAIQGKLA